MHKTTLDIDLRLFDGAAAGAAAGEGAGEGAAQADITPKAETKVKTGSSRRSKSGAYDNVVFGKQEDAPAAETEVTTPAAEGDNGQGEATKSGVETTSDSLEAKRAAFKEMIEGEYKDQYTEMFQQAFSRRFKEVKGMENSLNEQKPIIDTLLQRYNIADGDIKKLQTAIDQDDVYWEDAAEKAGLTVDQFKAMQKLERENAELRLMKQRQQGEQQAQQQLSAWYAEAEKVKEVYPSFDFKSEAINRDFLGLLRSGVSVKQAYELMHMEEIKTAAAKAAAQSTSEQMVAKMKSNAARPLENGTSAQSAAIVKNDVSRLSRADRAEIARRVQRGEQIKF